MSYIDNKKKWKIIEVIIRNHVGVIVSELDLEIPRYSFRIGTAKYSNNGDPPHITPWLDTRNVLEAAELLTEIEEKYSRIRQEYIDEKDNERDGPIVVHKNA